MESGSCPDRNTKAKAARHRKLVEKKTDGKVKGQKEALPENARDKAKAKWAAMKEKFAAMWDDKKRSK